MKIIHHRNAFLNSRDRLPSSRSSTDFEMTFNNSLPQINKRRNQLVKLQLLNITFPYSYYTFNSFNNKLSITMDDPLGGVSGTAELIIPVGNYSVNDLKTELPLLLNVLSFGALGTFFWWVEFDKKTCKFRIGINSSSYQINFNFANTTDPCNIQLGYNLENYLGDGGTAVNKGIQAPNICRLNGHSSLYLRSNFVNSSVNLAKQQTSNIICKIPIQTNFFGVISFQPKNIYYFNHDLTNVFTFQLTTPDLVPNIIDLNGGHIELSFDIAIVEQDFLTIGEYLRFQYFNENRKNRKR